MGVNTLPAEYILRKHNLEIYLIKKIEPQVPFLSLLPTTNNDTGEFSTVIEASTAKEDMDNNIMGEPMEAAEGSEYTDIVLEPINVQLGQTIARGFQFKYTDKFLNRQDSDARVAQAISKLIAGMAHYINSIILEGIVNSAAGAFPTDLSDWATEIDPRADFIKMRDKFSAGASGEDDLVFELDTVFISNARHVDLQDYYMSMDWPFNNKAIDVDGTMVNNVKNAFKNITDVELVGMDSKIPPGIVEKYVNPKYSVVRQAELQDPQKTIDLPDSLINVNFVEPRKAEEPYIYQVFADLGYNSLEPKGAIKGELTT